MESYRNSREAREEKKSAAEVEEKDDVYVHSVECTFKKRSVFFQLEYWEKLELRNNLDIMHVEKNVFDNIVNTILDVDKRTKDNFKSRLDLKDMNIRAGLHVDLTGTRPVIPRAIYHLSIPGKKIFLKVLKYARFPEGYASKKIHKVDLDDNRIHGLKSHDCHIIMIDLLPLALFRSLPESVAKPLARLSKYFKSLYGKVVSVKEMMKWENEIPIILCEMEKIFPPSFFDIMVHLVIHLAKEVRIGGPIQYRSMWSMERFIGKLANMVHTTTYPEGSIAEGYIFDEGLTFCSRYLHDCPTKSNRNCTIDGDLNPIPTSKDLPYLRLVGRPLSSFAVTQLDRVSWIQAQRCVLMSYPHISEYAK
jgi:hypothetical protein